MNRCEPRRFANWHIKSPFVGILIYYTFVPRNSTQMRLQSGSMIVDFYPTKSWIDDVINEDKFLKVLTFSGETMKKKINCKTLEDGLHVKLEYIFKDLRIIVVRISFCSKISMNFIVFKYNTLKANFFSYPS